MTKLNILTKCCLDSCLNASQNCRTVKTDNKCNYRLKYFCYACYQDIFSFFARLDQLITIGIITIGTGMLGTIFGIGIVMIKKNFSFP